MNFSSNITLKLGAIGLLASLALSGCAFLQPFGDGTDRNSAGEIVGEGALGALQIKQGDCVNDLNLSADEETKITEVTGVPCSGAHVFEVYYETSLLNQSLDQILDAQPAICEEEFEKFVGSPYSNTALEFTYLSPTIESYALGDRSVICIVYTADLSPVEGSLRGRGAEYPLAVVQSMKVGDCLDVVYDSSGNPIEERAVSCDEPHVYEVFFVGPTPSDSLDGIRAEATDVCLDEWERYKSPSLNADDYLTSPLTPSDEGYAQGDREVACYVHTEFLEPITGSLAG